MDISKKIDGERWSLSQDRFKQIVIKKGKDIIAVENLDHRLDTKEAFALLSKAPTMKFHNIQAKGNDEKLNMETEVIEENKIKVPVPHMCVFCGAIPKVINVRLNETDGDLRTLQCKCISSDKTFKRWVYSVGVVNGKYDQADCQLITEWNRRMPEVKR